MAGLLVAWVSKEEMVSKVKVEASFTEPAASMPLKYIILRPLLLGYIPLGPAGYKIINVQKTTFQWFLAAFPITLTEEKHGCVHAWALILYTCTKNV